MLANIIHNLKVPLITLAIAGVGFVLGWALWTIREYEKHRKEATGHILGVFQDEATHDEEEILCKLVDRYKVIPPGIEAKKAKVATKDNPKGFYILTGSVKKQPILDEKGEDTGKTYSGTITTHSLWPPGKPSRTQRTIEKAYFIKGDYRPRNPFNGFLPVNSIEAVRILADDNALEAISQHIRADIEALLRMFEDVKATAKNMKFLTYGVIGAILVSGIGLVLSFLIMRKLG